MSPKGFFKNILAAIMMAVGCQSVDLTYVQQTQDNEVSLISSSMKVTPDLVETYLKGFKGVVATRVSDVTVDPVMNGSDTVMYLVNYPEGGWELLSADKRIPTRLMVGETGSMTISQIEEHPGMSILLNDMREQISAVKRSEQTDPVTDKGVFWSRISSDIPETRSDNIIWNLYDTEIVTLSEIFVDHLIETKWNQSTVGTHWYNRFVPYKNSQKINTSAGRCVTGCVPVAAAQMLNFLQPILGFSTSFSFLECRCESFIADGDTCTTYGVLDPNVATYKSNDLYWDYVGGTRGNPEEQDKAIATLMAFLGCRLNAEYQNFYSYNDGAWVRQTSASTRDLKDVFKEHYNIDSEYKNSRDFSDTYIYESVYLNEMPVIVRASGPDGGHCWIVDGYYSSEKAINYYYMGIDPSAFEPVYKIVQCVAEGEEYYLMNWGWGGTGDDGIYYTDSSSWAVPDTPYSFTLSTRGILYDFKNIE